MTQSEINSPLVARVAMTGAKGFLGWHTKSALLEFGVQTNEIALGNKFDRVTAEKAISGSSRLIHLAGVNRAAEEEVHDGNVLFANQIADALRHSDDPPRTVVYANSVQAGNGTVYGEAKAVAGDILAGAAAELGLEFVNLRLPNLFGEHGRPFYNAVTATFCHLLAEGGTPEVAQDKELTLLHAQDAADLLIGTVNAGSQADLEVKESVSGLLRRLSSQSEIYSAGEIPNISTSFDRNLFNTYRSYTFDRQTPIRLTRHADRRGSFFEVVRSRGGQGQMSFSTTVPGVSRGDHFHRRKIERFTVLSGCGTIALRRLFTDEIFEFQVNGDEPVAIDMPTMWTHNITNTGVDTLFTQFWINEIFDPENADTVPVAVGSREQPAKANR